MKYKTLTLVLFTVIGLVSVQSCEKEEENETKISSYSSSESHNNGQNCMSCHVSGGEGESLFIAAGSVYDSTLTQPLANATVKLYSEPNGTGSLVATIEVDKNGNFYTTENIDFGAGLYPAVKGPTLTKYMGSKISNGQCNSCHGVTNDKIWTK